MIKVSTDRLSVIISAASEHK